LVSLEHEVKEAARRRVAGAGSPTPERGNGKTPTLAVMRIASLVLVAFLSAAAPACKSKDSSGKSSAKDDDDEGSSKKKKSKKTEKDDEEGEGDDALDPFAKDHLAITKKAARCDDESEAKEPWCLAANGFAKAERAKLPETGTFVGVTTFVQTKGASPATLEKYTHLSSLAFRADGDEVLGWVTEVKPDTPAETTEVERIRDKVFAQFAGKKAKIEAEAGLRGYLDGLPKKAKYKLEKHAHGYKLDGGSYADLRKVGKYWVAVEVPRKDPAGIWLSVFTNQPYD
jgi:hypothetical protein